MIPKDKGGKTGGERLLFLDGHSQNPTSRLGHLCWCRRLNSERYSWNEELFPSSGKDNFLEIVSSWLSRQLLVGLFSYFVLIQRWASSSAASTQPWYLSATDTNVQVSIPSMNGNPMHSICKPSILKRTGWNPEGPLLAGGCLGQERTPGHFNQQSIVHGDMFWRNVHSASKENNVKLV